MKIRLNTFLGIAGLLVLGGCASFIYHLTTDHARSGLDEVIGTALAVGPIFLSLLLALLYAPRWQMTWKQLAALLGALLLVSSVIAPVLFHMPPWSEDQGWFVIAQNIADGTWIHPLRFKSDYPSILPAYPIAAFLSIVGDPFVASRIAALAFLLLVLVAIAAIEVELSEQPGLSPFLLPCIFGLSAAAFFPVLTDWHEITIDLLLIISCWYFAIRAWRREELSSFILVGIFAGIALWTLYTPAAGCAVILLALSTIPQKRLMRERILMCIVFVCVSAPVFGWTLRSHFAIFDRHYGFLVRNAEHAPVEVPALAQRLVTFKDSSSRLIAHINPWTERSSFDQATEIRLEPLILLLVLIGALSLIFQSHWSLRWLVAIPSILLYVIIVASKPTVWREHCLAAPLWILGVVGWISLRKSLERIGLSVRKTVLLALFLWHGWTAFAKVIPYSLSVITLAQGVGHSALVLREILLYHQVKTIALTGSSNIHRMVASIIPRPHTIVWRDSNVPPSDPRELEPADAVVFIYQPNETLPAWAREEHLATIRLGNETHAIVSLSR